MRFFKETLIVVLIFCASFARADDDCTFSKPGILENIERIAERFPGAFVDTEKNRATWARENGDSEYYNESGCYDLGGAAGRVTQMSERRSSEAVRQVVLELAERFLPYTEAARISSAFKNGSYESHANDSEDFIFIEHPFGEIVVTHRFEQGSDTVEVAWPIA